MTSGASGSRIRGSGSLDSIEDFVALLRDHVGLQISVQDVPKSLDEIPGWDSLHLLWIMTAVHRRTGRSVPIPELLEAGTLEDVYRLAVAA